MKITLEDGQRFAVDFPDAFQTKHTAILGTTGAGKTSVAKVALVEPLLKAGNRVHVIDPKTDWWGLRLNRKGKAFGNKPMILGGERGDYPLRVADVQAITEALATSSDSVILDTKGMMVNERMEFFIKYAETILRKNRGPLNIVIDEAHLFLPQQGAKVGGLAPRMLHAGNEMLSSGRSQGLRIALLTQRPQKLHKDSLTLVQSLIAMRMFHPRDRAAIEEWMAEVADPKKGQAIMDSLHELKPGEAWAWSPVDRFMERIQFPMPLTFDSSKAPEMGDADVPTLEPIDMEALTGKLAKLAEEKAANDPVKLKARIRELEKGAPAITGEQADEYYRQGSASGYKKGWHDGHAAGVIVAANVADEQLEMLLEHIAKVTAGEIHQMRDNPREYYEGEPVLPYNPHTELLRGSPRGGDGKSNRPHPPARKPHETAQRPVSKPPSSVSDGGPLSTSDEKIVIALLYFSSIGQDTPTKVQVAAVAGYNHGGGRFNNLLGALRSRGVIEYPTPGTVRLIGDYSHLIDDFDARTSILSVVSASERKVLEAAGPEPITREDLAEASSYDARGGRFNNIVGRLCTLGLLEKRGVGTVSQAEWVAEILQ